MFFDLEGGQFTIDGKNLVFKDTAYQGEDFRVFVTQPDGIQMDVYRRQANTREGINNSLLVKAIWSKHVHGWEIKGKGGKDIPFNEENKKTFLEKQRPFVNLVVAACMDRHNQPEDEEVKKTSEPIGNTPNIVNHAVKQMRKRGRLHPALHAKKISLIDINLKFYRLIDWLSI
jgi:hypothetical protein